MFCYKPEATEQSVVSTKIKHELVSHKLQESCDQLREETNTKKAPLKQSSRVLLLISHLSSVYYFLSNIRSIYNIKVE